MVDFYMVIAGKYTIHGWYGIDHEPLNLQRQQRQQQTQAQCQPYPQPAFRLSGAVAVHVQLAGFGWCQGSMTRNLHTLGKQRHQHQPLLDTVSIVANYVAAL